MQDQEIWKLARETMNTAIAECSIHAGQSSALATELLEEGIATFRELIPNRPRMLGQILGEYLFKAIAPNADATQNKPDAVAALINGKANIDWRNADGKTALHYAISNNKWEMARTLVEHGADLNALLIDPKDKKTIGTPLQHAVRNGSLTAVERLLEIGAMPDVEDPVTGTTALRLAVGRRHDGGVPSAMGRYANETLELVKTLLEHGADPSRSTREDTTPLHDSIHSSSCDAATSYLLQSSEWDVNALNTALNLAISHDRCEVIQALVDAGADPSVTVDGKPLLDLEENRFAKRETAELINSLIIERAVTASLAGSAGESGMAEAPKQSFGPL